MGRRTLTRALLRRLWRALCWLIGLEIVRPGPRFDRAATPIALVGGQLAVPGIDFRWPSTWPRPIATARTDLSDAFTLATIRRTR